VTKNSFNKRRKRDTWKAKQVTNGTTAKKMMAIGGRKTAANERENSARPFYAPALVL
jgi:hypothetical protein